MSKPDEVNEFYGACRDGNINFVKEYLEKNSSSKSDLNECETNVNDTPLHIACQNGHEHIVKLLLEHGCDRSHQNSDGQTPYEVAKNDEIRQLFKRPSDNSTMRRFQDDGTENCFDLVKRPNHNVSTSTQKNK